MHPSRPIPALLLLLTLPALLTAEIRLPRAIGDHMVLQQDTLVTFWGWARPRETITVVPEWDAREVNTVVEDDGSWSLEVRTPPAFPGDPAYRVTISGSRSDAVAIEDVLIGEVWLLAGQSNMEQPLAGWPQADPPGPVEGGPGAIATAHHPRLRFLAAGRHPAATPQADLAEHWQASRWTVCTPDSAAGFSAVGCFFGEELLHHLELPIGLIQSAWGGSSAEAWTPPLALEGIEAFASQGPWTPTGAEDNRTPTVLYHGMIAPLHRYVLRGVLWYQGETNVGQHETYARLLPALVSSWREAWRNDSLAFFAAQLAPWGGYGPTSLPLMWEAQTAILDLPHTGIVATIDLGDADNIHPPRKQPVGHRFAALALARVYGDSSVAASGPRPVAHWAEGARFVLRFEETAGGLVVPENQYIGFELAGEDGNFHPARGEVRDDTLVLTSPMVKAPVRARYAWTPLPVPSLFNRAGLPASPFRTPLP
jgi:sialate O-acetylesterase